MTTSPSEPPDGAAPEQTATPDGAGDVEQQLSDLRAGIDDLRATQYAQTHALMRLESNVGWIVQQIAAAMTAMSSSPVMRGLIGKMQGKG